MPWLFNEDAALKFKLQGLKVSDANMTDRPVPVRYRSPEMEVADLTFPIILIQHNGWPVAPEREHRGLDSTDYAYEGLAPWWNDTGPATTQYSPMDSPYKSYFPIPYNFDYIITVYSRFMHEHTMPLIASLAAYDRLHPRFGFLDVPQDGTKRTLQLLGGPDLETGTDNNDKRIFWVNYIIRVFSELTPPIASAPTVSGVHLDLSVYLNQQDMTITELEQAHGIVSTGANIGWNTAQLY